MGRLAGIVVVLAASMLTACGGSTTTVVNNTTTITAAKTTDATTVTTTSPTFAQCGDGTEATSVQSTQVDCDEALSVAQAWHDKCLGVASASCLADGYSCLLRASGGSAGDVTCKDDAAEVRFSFGAGP